MSTDSELASAALTEREKMVAGLAYDAMADQGLTEGRLRARKLLERYNGYPSPAFFPDMKPSDYFGPDERFGILGELFGISGEEARAKLSIEPPFYCDYGVNIKFNGEFYCNFGTTILDCANVVIGTRVMLAPNVHIYAATHSTDVVERRAGLERAYPVTIGDDVWIGGNVSIIGPATIGNGCTVAAGAVVRGTWPDNVVIGGNPARILKQLEAPPPMV